MRGKMALAFSLLLSFALGVSAQTASKARDDAKTPISRSDVEITTALESTPRFQIDNVSITHSSKDSKNVGKKWIAVEVSFMTNKADSSKTGAWGSFLDDVEVELTFLCPGFDEKMRPSWTVFKGVQVLNPVAADGERHYVRFFIPPYVTNRYFAFGKDMKDLDKIVPEIPMFVNIKYSNYASAQGVQKCGKYFGDKLGADATLKTVINTKALTGKETARVETAKLFNFVVNNIRSFYTVEDAALSASKTPWAWFNYDKYESSKDETPSRRR